MSGVNKFSGEGQGKIHHFVIAKNNCTIAKEKLEPSKKVTLSDEVEKCTNLLNDMEEPVHTICIKDLIGNG